jgi:hypothetical protein
MGKLHVTANSTYTTALYAQSSGSGYAGLFAGNVHVGGTLTKLAGDFLIDHPLDPDNKYLRHSFVESPEMKNIYDGVAQLDDAGEAWVELPPWFQALNQDFRYQLTPIGRAMPNVYVAQEVQGNRFQIAGGAPAGKVSWQVTGVRHDAYATAHPLIVEQPKARDERGCYLFPEGFGLGDKRRILAPGSMSAAPAGAAETDETATVPE